MIEQGQLQGLRTQNEGITQKNLKNWSDDKYTLVIANNLGVGVDYQPCSEGDLLTGRLCSIR